jgi:hypothetical protein
MANTYFLTLFIHHVWVGGNTLRVTLLHLTRKAKHLLASAKGSYELVSVCESFRRRVAKLSINFQEILSRTNVNFKGVLESSIIIIN